MMKQLTSRALAGIVVMGMIVAVNAEAQRARRPDPSAKKREEHIVRHTNVQYISMHRMSGCGLGSLAFEKDDKVSQVASAFLNGTGMQTFAISFGTSNCTYDGVTEAAREREAFTERGTCRARRRDLLGEKARRFERTGERGHGSGHPSQVRGDLFVEVRGQRTDIADCNSFRDCRTADGHRATCKLLRRRGIGFHFDADHFDRRRMICGCDRATRRQTRAADRHHETIE